jgi:hypothetical protein
VRNPSSRSCSSDRLRRRMGTHLQSITEPTHEHEIENATQTQSVGVGVSEAALDVFSNFLEHIVANVAAPSETTLNMQADNPPPRRSKRFCDPPRSRGSASHAARTPTASGTIHSPHVQQRWAPVRVSFETTVIGTPACPRSWVPASGHECPSSPLFVVVGG